jgi:cytochrome c peroxidase
MGTNHTLSQSDFPFHQRENPLFDTSPVTHDSDDVISSSGTFSGIYQSSSRVDTAEDQCNRSADPVFHAGALGTRRVQPRNTPTVLNAIFNHRSFWDGRANNVFNGSSHWGDRDPNAGIWVKINGRKVIKERLRLINSSLASQALAPPLNTGEMTCAGRSLPDLGRKLLMRKPLEHQKVHYQDSVLGSLSLSDSENQLPGLNTTYSSLIKQSFNSKYWSFRRRGAFGSPASGLPYKQIEANFGMFFALAIQLYESTLITDQSPFDLSARDADGIPTDLSSSEVSGLKLFRDNNCAHCHTGPNFTTASVAANAAFAKIHPEAFGNDQSTVSTTTNVVTRTLLTDGIAFFDTGYTATGVVDTTSDIGAGGVDSFGTPLSFSKQYLQFLAGNHVEVVDKEVTNIRPCDFQEAFAINIVFPFPQNNMFTPDDGVKPQIQSTENCFGSNFAYLPTEAVAAAELESPGNHKMLHAVNGAFKIPSLRNIELTGPYMHNGGLATLEQVIEFYSRGGNFNLQAKQSEKVFPLHLLQNSPQNRADLIAFLKTLTDDRVRYEKAPFDHPEIKIPHGHVGNNATVTANNPLSPELAQDEFLVIEAVGSNGNAAPLLPFEEYLAP